MDELSGVHIRLCGTVQLTVHTTVRALTSIIGNAMEVAIMNGRPVGYLLAVFGAVLAMALQLLTSCAVLSDSDSTNEAYVFPVRPGMNGWRAFTTHEQMIEACQIPHSTLGRLSTSALAWTVLDYPLFDEVLVHNSLQDGVDTLCSQFNGLSQLFLREDAGKQLLAIYSKLDPSAPSPEGDMLMRLEILLAQPAGRSGLDETEMRSLVETGLTHYLAKREQPERYGISLVSSAWLLGRALYAVNDPVFTQRVTEVPMLKAFLDTGLCSSLEEISEVIACCEQFVSSK